jgi:N-acetylneuraminic acid mutarotase
MAYIKQKARQMITPILSEVKTNKSYYLAQDSTYQPKLELLGRIFNLVPLAMPILILNLIILFNTSIIYAATESTSAFDFEDSSRWTKGEKMPTPRTELLADAIDEKIYVIGGVDFSKGVQLAIMEIYDTKKNEWITSAEPLPQAIDHSAAVAYNGKIYVVGGYLEGKVPTDKLFIYDPMKDKWEEGKPLPSPRGALTAEFINGTLYAVGGLNSSEIPVNTNEAYDPETNTWTTKAPMPTARHHLASAVIDGKLFVMGGRILGDGVPSEDMDALLTNFNRNEMYDPETDMWIVKQPMLDKISGFAATSANRQIYVFGGQGVGKTLDSVEKYNPATNKWTFEPSMPSERMGLEAVTVDNKIYTIGGQIATDSGLVALDVNEIFNLKNENDEIKNK